MLILRRTIIEPEYDSAFSRKMINDAVETTDYVVCRPACYCLISQARYYRIRLGVLSDRRKRFIKCQKPLRKYDRFEAIQTRQLETCISK